MSFSVDLRSSNPPLSMSGHGADWEFFLPEDPRADEGDASGDWPLEEDPDPDPDLEPEPEPGDFWIDAQDESDC